jgi:hypothetical protein
MRAEVKSECARLFGGTLGDVACSVLLFWAMFDGLLRALRQ